MEQTIKVLFIGAGRMSQAIIAGLVKDSRFEISVTNNGNQKRLINLQDTYDVAVKTEWEKELTTFNIIVLAMPPEAHDEVLRLINPIIDGQLVITVAAGIGPTQLEQQLPKGTPVAWIMPNTAAELGQSTTLYTLGQYVQSFHQNVVEDLIKGIGVFEKVSEQQIHELTPITGSAPAFIYEIAESLVNSALESGITEDKARKLVAEMIGGAASMLKTGQSPKELKDQVATPGGVTWAGLNVLKENNLDGLMRDAIDACHKKAKRE
ncbi:pyrroline-5-carboxylate reductase [Aquibacillus saliphilus]|uniref:pyrroline-5-carboxylate reductase n=1 Tax=Aquibacillus saliphilus TaxID=1909422 RepID=UPI001CF06935|nr:pyrroline-5-carboxylate reductase [Aquibacillus saliphilus]